ncbi:PepSY-associated TM helix domain-containing protein [Paludibacteraceae bacterium OttesenSCG-928-F17]|nr:PepSY-associated TM helix domain-containing protein [Paludibacteraceae bacterium OttesenSCG-928-F17]
MKIRKIFRILHRDLSFLFSGMLMVYATSGIALNHKGTFNSQYSIERKDYHITQPIPEKEAITKETVLKLLEPISEKNNYTKHYFPEERSLKVFLKGGSNLVVDIATGNAIYESVKRRPVLGALSRLHYNPGKAWTIFADVFCIALIIIVITGLFMMKGRHSLWGIGGIELLIGILIPILFILI